jgi:uncharacterized cupredoxin-like copper-binding protein
MKRWLIFGFSLIVSLVMLTACSSRSQSFALQSFSLQTPAVQDVHITMTEMKIQSDVTTFTHGMAYHFIIVNQGNIDHEFEIAKKQPLNATEQQMDSGRLAELSRLNPGQTGTLDYTFTSAYPAGTMILVCGMPGHYSAGQYKDITVN